MFTDKSNNIKTFNQIPIANNSEYDKRFIIDNINTYLKSKI